MAQAAQPQREPERESRVETQRDRMAVQRDADWWRARETAAYPERGTMAQLRDQVRWGPIWAGVISAVAVMMLLSTLGVAIGATAFDAGDPALETGAYIWGGISALIAFFVGGYVAGRSAAVGGSMAGAFNGSMVWALALVLSVVLSALGAGAAIGLLGQFGVTGDEAAGLFGGLDETGLWWTFIAMVVGLVVASVGGLVGAPRNNPEAGRTAVPEG